MTRQTREIEIFESTWNRIMFLIFLDLFRAQNVKCMPIEDILRRGRSSIPCYRCTEIFGLIKVHSNIFPDARKNWKNRNSTHIKLTKSEVYNELLENFRGITILSPMGIICAYWSQVHSPNSQHVNIHCLPCAKASRR